jgi:hypothetical protein
MSRGCKAASIRSMRSKKSVGVRKLEGECPHEPWLRSYLNMVNAVNRVSPKSRVRGRNRFHRPAVAEKKGRDGFPSGPLFFGAPGGHRPTFARLAGLWLAGRTYPFIAERYTLYVHEDENEKIKSCTSTGTRT